MNDAVCHIQQVETGKRTEYHVSLNRQIAPKNGMDIEQASIDSKTLSSVISTVLTNMFSGQIDESISMLFTLFNLACKTFKVPEQDKLDLLTYALTGAARNHFLANKANCKSFLEAEAMMKRTYN